MHCSRVTSMADAKPSPEALRVATEFFREVPIPPIAKQGGALELAALLDAFARERALEAAVTCPQCGERVSYVEREESSR